MAIHRPDRTLRHRRNRDIREYIDERGKTRLRHIYDITMPFAGRIEPIRLREGDAVNAGEMVAQINRNDLITEMDQATAVVERLQAAIAEKQDHSVEHRAKDQTREFIKSMEHTVAAAAARKTAGLKRSEYFEGFLERAEELFRGNATSRDQLELAELQLVESQVDYQQDDLVWKSMQSILAATQLLPEIIDEFVLHKSLTVGVLEKEKAEAEARLHQVATRQERGTLTSPVDGVVLSRLVDDEQFVPAGETLVRIGCLADLEVEADVLTQDAARLPAGAAAEVYGLAAQETVEARVTGKVRRVFPQAFTKISSLGVEQQRVTVLVELSDQAVQSMLASQIGADYRVRVRIYAQQRDHVLVLPRSALFRDPEGGWQVFVVRDGRARVQDIEIGLMNDDRVEVTRGLGEGALVVLRPRTICRMVLA